MVIKNILNNPTYRFLILFIGGFTALYYFNIFILGITSPGNYYSPFLDKYFNYVFLLQDVLIKITVYILELLGYNTFTKDNWLHVSGKGGFILAYDCLGIGVMSFFTAFVIAFPKPLKSKLFFLPAGLILIQLLNLTRFILLSLYWKGSIFKDVIDHHDLFNLILYAILLGVIYLWVNGGKKEGEREKVKGIHRNKAIVCTQTPLLWRGWADRAQMRVRLSAPKLLSLWRGRTGR